LFVETGGKDFILAHKTANIKKTSRYGYWSGAFEFKRQKCSAALKSIPYLNLLPI